MWQSEKVGCLVGSEGFCDGHAGIVGFSEDGDLAGEEFVARGYGDAVGGDLQNGNEYDEEERQEGEGEAAEELHELGRGYGLELRVRWGWGMERVDGRNSRCCGHSRGGGEFGEADFGEKEEAVGNCGDPESG